MVIMEEVSSWILTSRQHTASFRAIVAKNKNKKRRNEEEEEEDEEEEEEEEEDEEGKKRRKRRRGKGRGRGIRKRRRRGLSAYSTFRPLLCYACTASIRYNTKNFIIHNK